MNKQKESKFGELVKWASVLGSAYDVNTTTILVQFRRLKNAGADIEAAKKEIEAIYAD